MNKFYPGDVVHYRIDGESYKVDEVKEDIRMMIGENTNRRMYLSFDKCYLLRRERDGLVACRENPYSEFGWVGRKKDETHPIIGYAATRDNEWDALVELLAPPKTFKRGDVVRLKSTVTKEDLWDFGIEVSVPTTPGIVVKTTERGNIQVAFEGLKPWYTYKPEWLEEIK